MPGAVGESGDRAAQVVDGLLTDRGRHARCAERNGHVAHGHAQAERGHGVVAAAGRDDASAGHLRAGDGWVRVDRRHLVRPKHAGQHDAFGMFGGGGARCGGVVGLQAQREQVAPVGVGGGVEVQCARGVGTVGEQGVEMRVFARLHGAEAGDAPAQPVVRQADGGDACRVRRFVLRHPLDFGECVRGDGGGAHGLHPTFDAALVRVLRLAVGRRRGAELIDERFGLRRRARVVPQHRVADHPALFVERHHAVLLAAHSDRGHIVQAAGLRGGFLERAPPVLGVDGGSVGVFRLSETHQFAGRSVGDAHLAGLGRSVDPGHKNSAHEMTPLFVRPPCAGHCGVRAQRADSLYS